MPGHLPPGRAAGLCWAVKDRGDAAAPEPKAPGLCSVPAEDLVCGPAVLPYSGVPGGTRPDCLLGTNRVGPGTFRASAGLICGPRIVTGACSNAPAAGWPATGSTLPPLAKTCCGTTVANRRLANCVFASFAGTTPFRGI